MKSNLFRFFVSGNKTEIIPGKGLWNAPLSGISDSFTQTSQHHGEKNGLSIGEYFDACVSFLSQDNDHILKTGLSVQMDKSVASNDIAHISVYLEKHGAFYHPLKLVVQLTNQMNVQFVINGAVSNKGLAVIEQESKLLMKFYQSGHHLYLPQVYGSGWIETPKGVMGFFMGQWLDGYKEFHLTQKDGEDQIVVWESDGTCSYFTMDQAGPIYKQAAKILTDLYHAQTGEQAFPWHHAAGDFVVKYENDRFDVKLITIRGFHSFSEFEPDPENHGAHILPSLLLFFVQMALRIRLDRLDGVGDYVLVNEDILPEVMTGFLTSLDEKSENSGLEDLKKLFVEFAAQFDLEQWKEITENVVQSYPSPPDEKALLIKNITPHCKIIEAFFKSV